MQVKDAVQASSRAACKLHWLDAPRITSQLTNKQCRKHATAPDDRAAHLLCREVRVMCKVLDDERQDEVRILMQHGAS